jgi:hypothetical protein
MKIPIESHEKLRRKVFWVFVCFVFGGVSCCFGKWENEQQLNLGGCMCESVCVNVGFHELTLI